MIAEVYLERSTKLNYLRNINQLFGVFQSLKNVLRGLHLQKKNSQGKFVSVLKGKILDVVVDLRPNSKTFCKSFKIELSEKTLGH